ncbi:MAG: hypothetical protein DRI61_03320 [Chloroflexi bacterium]|nr:MAG: hypothetical protein DRI61_03320 [Chloroflexota bacterium]
MSEKIVLDKEKQLELLKKIVRSVFGYDTKIDFTKRVLEADKVKIIDIDWDDDLVTILQRLREDFYILIEADSEEVEIEGVGKTKSERLNIELISKE